MKNLLFILAIVLAVILTYGGAEALVAHVQAADGLKSSAITFVLTLGYALLGPALLTAAVFFHRKNDSRSPEPQGVPETPKKIYRP